MDGLFFTGFALIIDMRVRRTENLLRITEALAGCGTVDNGPSRFQAWSSARLSGRFPFRVLERLRARFEILDRLVWALERSGGVFAKGGKTAVRCR